MSYNQETHMYDGYIYKVTNLITNKMYVCQTMRDISTRWKEHIRDSIEKVDDYYFHRSIRKYGSENFLVEMLTSISCLTLAELKCSLNQQERHYIHKYNTYNPFGYNGSFGGEGKGIRPIDHYSLNKEFICQYDSATSASEQTGLSIGHIIENCNGNCLGTKFGFFRYAGESLDKFETIYRYNGAIKINKFNLDGNIVDSYLSSNGIQDEYSVSRRVVLRWINHHVLVENRFIFFRDTEEFDYNLITVPFISKINVFDLNMNYITTFNSQSEASRNLHIDSSAISKCCLGKIFHVGDYIFRKVEWAI